MGLYFKNDPKKTFWVFLKKIFFHYKSLFGWIWVWRPAGPERPFFKEIALIFCRNMNPIPEMSFVGHFGNTNPFLDPTGTSD